MSCIIKGNDMILSLIRFAKRLAVLLPSLVVAYLSIFNIFPWLNDHLPLVAALILTYLLGAYVLIPATIRVFRILFPVSHLPHYSVTRDGFASDPLNIAIIGTRQQLDQALAAAGWHRADRLTLRSGVKMALSTVYNWSYPTGPVSSLYLFGRAQDQAFQKPFSNGNTGSRHHVRFWATNFDDDENLSVRSIDWQHRQKHLQHDRLLWVGAASRDIGVTFVRHNAQLTHLVDSDTNAERELLVSELVTSKQMRLKRTVALGAPYKLPNIRGWTGHLHTDGKMSVLETTAQTTASGSDSPTVQQ